MTAFERIAFARPPRCDDTAPRPGFASEAAPTHLNTCRCIEEIVVFVAGAHRKPARVTRPHHMCLREVL